MAKKKSILSVIRGVTASGNAATKAVEGYTAASNVARAVSTGSSYVAPTPTYYSPGSSSSSKAAAQAVAQAQAAVKAAKAVVSEYGQDKKNPKSVSGKYAKASEKAKKKRAKSAAQVKRKTREVKAKYETKRVHIKPVKQKTVPIKAAKEKKLDTYDKELKQAKWKPAQAGKAIAKAAKAASTAGKRHYFEDGSWVTPKKYEQDYSLPEHPRRAAQRRSDTLYAKTGLPGKAPKVKPSKRSVETEAGNPAAAWVPNHGNTVRLGLPAWGGLSGSRVSYDDETKALLLHEFAHTKQNPKTKESGYSEGLATRYAARVGRRLGIPPSITPEYRGYKKAAPAGPKTVMKRQFVNGKKRHKYQGTQSPEEYLSQKAPAPKYTDVPKFGPGNAYKIWEGANQIAAKAKELSKGKTGRAETEATRNAARAAAALSRAVTGGEAAGPKPRKVANRLEKAVRRSGPDTSAYEGLGPAAPQLAEAAVKYGKEFGIDPSFLMGIAEIETGFGAAAGSGTPGAGAVSSAGAKGYMQFIPESRDAVLKATGYDAYSSDPKEAMAAAAGYFSVFAPDAQSNYDRAFSYNHADWYANDVLEKAKKYTALDNADVSEVPTRIKRTARQTLGKKPTKAILQGGKVVKDKNAGEEESGAPSYKETKQYIVPTEARSEIRAEQRAPARTMVTGMDPALQAALVQLAKNTGIPVRINEGYRTEARANDFPSGTASQHHQGNATDIDNNADYSAEDLAKVGLNNTAVGGDPWHFQLNNPDATASTVNTNIPIKGTNLAVKVPTPTSTSGATGTTTSGGTTSTGAPVPGTPEYQQMMNEVRRRRGPSVAKRLAAIDRWMTSPVTAPTPDISQELIDRILGK